MGCLKKKCFRVESLQCQCGSKCQCLNGAGGDLIVKAPEEETHCVSTQAGRPLPSLLDVDDENLIYNDCIHNPTWQYDDSPADYSIECFLANI
jgi:hypothetical protein